MFKKPQATVHGNAQPQQLWADSTHCILNLMLEGFTAYAKLNAAASIDNNSNDTAIAVAPHHIVGNIHAWTPPNTRVHWYPSAKSIPQSPKICTRQCDRCYLIYSAYVDFIVLLCFQHQPRACNCRVSQSRAQKLASLVILSH
jgi:hypothetical protein